MKKYLVLLILLVSLVSCEDFLENKISQDMTSEQLLTQPDRVRGLVYFAYRGIPNTNDNFGSDFLECATDNAVSVNLSGSMSRISEQDGYLSAAVNPFNVWGSRYEEIMSINKFFTLEKENDITYIKSSAYNDSIVRAVTTGEAYFLRAWAHFDLLRRFGGKAIDPADGNEKMMGVIVAHEDITPEEFLGKSRSTYMATVDSIVKDLDSAMVYLPEEWLDIPETNINYQYLGEGNNIGRPTQIICQALKSRLYLYAASPAFSEGLTDAEVKGLYEKSATASKAVLDNMGFEFGRAYWLYGVDDPALGFYNAPQTAEMLMRRITGSGAAAAAQETGLETRHLIPSLYGGGRCNPSQNLVDAFPMKNGYPIDHASSGYDPNNPYANRDVRLAMTVLYNGASFHDVSVDTYVGGKDYVGGSDLAKTSNSTRTGYYLRKWLSTKVNLASGQIIKDYHYSSIFRTVEMHLNFAEAVFYLNNMNATAQFDGKSAKDAILALNERADYTYDGKYLDEAAGDATKFEAMIKNQRRIELCFEGGHRFFDLRRWLDPLAVTVNGISFADANDTKGTVFPVVDKLAFDDNNPYLPLPQSEINVMPYLTQNTGW